MASSVVIISAMIMLYVLLFVGRGTESTPVPSPPPTPSLAPSCPPIVSRAEWRARKPSAPLQPLPHSPVSLVFIHHGSSPPDGCHSNASCASIVRAYQNYHMDTRGWSDIGYSFLVGEDGRAYEGRGWTTVGAHTYGYNDKGLGICVIGDFNHRIPNESALNKLRALIQCGVDSGYITSDYHMMGHRDTNSKTDCPGNTFYPFLRTWPHYNSTL